MDVDPEAGVLAFRAKLRGTIAMPGRRMYDGHDPNLFDHFAVVFQRLGVYTTVTYADIIAHFVDTWDIAKRSLSGKAAKAQDYICQQAERYRRLADMVAKDMVARPAVPFSWVHGTPV